MQLLLVLLALVAVAAGLLWSVIRNRLMTPIVLRADIPAKEAFAELVRSANDPAQFLVQMWRSGKIPHRELVLNHLKLSTSPASPLDDRLLSLLREGAVDADVSVREAALATLHGMQHDLLMPLAKIQLHDPDPHLRFLGLQYLRRLPKAQGVPLFMTMIDDPDGRVATSAESALRQWSGEDFGVRIGQSVPKENAAGQFALNPEDIARIQQGLRQRRQWWKAHQAEFPPADSGQAAPLPALPVEDFTLTKLDGSTVRLSAYRGRTVLLNFWATWCTACLLEVPDLVQLQQRLGDRLVILGVSLDGVPDAHGHAAGHDDEPDEAADARGHAPKAARNPKRIRARLARTIRTLGINYPVFHDPQNAVGSRFNGGELPTNVLIDAAGHLRRRFVGARKPEVLAAMVRQISN